jgi:hypothetical protein
LKKYLQQIKKSLLLIKGASMKKTTCLLLSVCLALVFAAPRNSLSADFGRLGKNKEAFDTTSTNISATFKKFIECNAGGRSHATCTNDFAAPYFHFDYAAIEQLRKYHIIMLPGGDFDVFSELVTLCEEEKAEELQAFFDRYPVLGAEIKMSVEREVCPDYMNKTENYYDKFMDAYIEYEQFFGSNDIPFTRLQFAKHNSPKYIGDRADKLILLGDIIDGLEARYGDNNSKEYILLGHSFGGLNVTDFLMELAGAHVPGTPEDRLFAETNVRNWPAEKKERIFNKIKGVGLINTFVQGLLNADDQLQSIAESQNISGDFMEHYINRVLNKYEEEEFESDNLTPNTIYHLTMRSFHYRTGYYLKDKNSAGQITGTPVQAAMDRIAAEKAVFSVGCFVPRLLPAFFVQPNMIVHFSKNVWRNDGVLNDGMVDTYSGILPRKNVEFILLPNLDHGALVLKPQVRGISIGHTYDQLPFIKTFFKRMMTKIQELPGNS